MKIFVAATCREKSNQTEFVGLVAGTKFCCRDKDFDKNYPVHTTRFTKRSDVSPQPVAANCRLVCSDFYDHENLHFESI